MSELSRPPEQTNVKAAAVKYRSSDAIPSLLASGEGDAARKILALAEKHGIPIQEDPSLSALLNQIPNGAEIPETAFSLMAEVLCFLYEMDKKWRDQHAFLKDIVD